MTPLARALFEPRAVALVGASGDAGKNTARPQRFLRRHGWTGTIYPINRERTEIFGEPAYATLDDVPGPVDHAFVMLPGAQVPDALEACGRLRVPVVTVYSDGFAETGPGGADAQRALAARARELGVRLLGPNCIGLVDICGRMPLTVNATLAGELAPPGRTAFVSHSGSMLGTVLSRGQARGMGFSRLVSVGNEADLGIGEIARMLVDDPRTDVVLLFLETLRDAPALADAARAAHAARKAIVAYKLGRSEQGAQLAVSHTGALAGTDAAFDAFFRAHGIVRVDMIETLIEIAPLLARRSARPAPARAAGRSAADADVPRRAPRVAVVSTTGGGAAMVVDRLGGLGLRAAAPPEAFVAAMAAQGIGVRAAPVIDLTLAATPRTYAAVLRGLLEADFCDAVLAVAGSSAQFQPALAVEPIIAVMAERAWDKPMAVFLAPQADASLALLAQRGIAAFRTPEACADALAARMRWTAPRGERAAGEPWAGDGPPADGGGPAGSAAAGVSVVGLATAGVATAGVALDGVAAAAAGATLDEVRSLAVFDALGVPTVARAVLRGPPWTHALGWPVAAKLVCAGLPHKTEAGAVTLGVADAAALAEAVQAMTASARRHAPGCRIDGVLVQPMVAGLAEVLVGYRHDPLVGPIVTVGVGGRLAELYRDVSIRIAPVDATEAREMIDEVRGLAPIRGWRGLPAGDLDALAAAVVAVSRLSRVAGQPVAEAEINPLIVARDGVVAVDALVVLAARRE